MHERELEAFLERKHLTEPQRRKIEDQLALLRAEIGDQLKRLDPR